MKEKIKVFIKEGMLKLPEYSTENASGMDVRVNFTDFTIEQIEERITGKSTCTINSKGVKQVLLRHGDTYLFPTGLFVALPAGYEFQVRPRSGMALKFGVTVLNTPGTIDADYRGEIGIIAFNATGAGTVITDNERIAQIVCCPVEKVEWVTVKKLPPTKRGEGGFNSTGKN